MNKSAFAFIGLIILLAACGKTVKETPNGLKYTIIEAGDGDRAHQGRSTAQRAAHARA